MEKTDNSYIAIDLETTGLNPKTERIIEIGAARVEDGTVVHQLNAKNLIYCNRF